jgi:hypothetical protein
MVSLMLNPAGLGMCQGQAPRPFQVTVAKRQQGAGKTGPTQPPLGAWLTVR